MSSAYSSRNTPLVPERTGDTPHNVHNAALRGASSAFSKPPVKPKPQVNTYTGGNNGALLAATKVGTGSPANISTQSPIRRDWTGGSTASRPSASPMRILSHSGSSSNLSVPDDNQFDREPSPSNIAAKLAAARYSPMKPIPHHPSMSTLSERDQNERDVMPPAGSVRKVLARLDSGTSVPQQPQRKNSTGGRSTTSTIRQPIREDKLTDDTPIPPTTSLVNMFEQNRPTTPTNRPTQPINVSHHAPPIVRSPKPQRKFKLPPEPKDDVPPEPLERKRTRTPPPIKPKPTSQPSRTLSIDGTHDMKSFGNLRKDTLGTPPIKQKPPKLTVVKTPTSQEKPAVRERQQSRPKSEDTTKSATQPRRFSTSASLDSNDNVSSPSSFVSAKEEQFEEKPKPSLPPPRRSTKTKTEVGKADLRPKSPKTIPLPPPSRGTSKIAAPMSTPERFPTPIRRPTSAMTISSSPQSEGIYHSKYQRESVKQITQHMTGESLSSAMLGAALASSRNVSPARPQSAAPVLPPRKQHHHHNPLHHNRSPSPQKPQHSGRLRTTLRKEPSSSSDEDESERYKKKGTRVMGLRRKHPNKHHEGTRKRWRDTITERERKRYEGVWAANKGVHISTPSQSPSRTNEAEDPALDVLNLVTREIWLRSRLPDHVLEEVWELVDGRGVGRLRREEFVVGMWLIDQRLKGRKLPIKVSDSVWGSVKGFGVKVKVHK